MIGRAELLLLVPASIDDPERVSGGNVYDRQVRRGLRSRGWRVRTVGVADAAEARAALVALARGALVVVDGLAAEMAPEAVEDAAERCRLVVLAHMVHAAFPGSSADEVDAERRVVAAAQKVIATSAWAAEQLSGRGLIDADRVAVAIPGARSGRRSAVPDHRALLCVGAIARHKGQDVLLAALRRLPRDDWTCDLVGSAQQDPAYAAEVADAAAGFHGRVRMRGTLHGRALGRAYGRAGLAVAPSRSESFGMAVVDARRRGLPIVASAVGGIPEAVADSGGVLVPPDDPDALARVLRRWLDDAGFRRELDGRARAARAGAPRWADTVDRVHDALVSA